MPIEVLSIQRYPIYLNNGTAQKRLFNRKKEFQNNSTHLQRDKLRILRVNWNQKLRVHCKVNCTELSWITEEFKEVRKCLISLTLLIVPTFERTNVQRNVSVTLMTRRLGERSQDFRLPTFEWSWFREQIGQDNE